MTRANDAPNDSSYTMSHFEIPEKRKSIHILLL